MYALHGLACNLPHTFPCNQSKCIVLLRNHLSRPHHCAFEVYRQLVMCHVVQQIKLQFRKRYNIQPKFPCKIRNALRKVNDLFFCPFACIRGTMEVNALYFHTTLCHHPRCHRAVNPAGKQADRPAVACVGQTAVGTDDFGMEVHAVAYLDMQRHIRIFHINLQIRHPFQYIRADLHADLHGRHRKTLVCPSCIHLECHFLIPAEFLHVQQAFFADALK